MGTIPITAAKAMWSAPMLNNVKTKTNAPEHSSTIKEIEPCQLFNGAFIEEICGLFSVRNFGNSHLYDYYEEDGNGNENGGGGSDPNPPEVTVEGGNEPPCPPEVATSLSTELVVYMLLAVRDLATQWSSGHYSSAALRSAFS